MSGRIVPPRSDSELARALERGEQLGRRLPGLPQILRKCTHPAGRLKITARGAHSIIVVCGCGAGTLALLMPERALSRAETDAIVDLARQSEW